MPEQTKRNAAQTPTAQEPNVQMPAAQVSIRVADLPAEATSARAFASLIAAWPEPEPAVAPAPAQKPRNGALSQEAIRRIADRAEQASAKKR